MRTVLPGRSEAATVGMAFKPVLVAALRRIPGVRVLFLTDAFGVVTRRPGFPGVSPVRDPVTPPREAADTAREPAGRTRIGVLGVISPRKNVPVLVRAAVTRGDIDVVLAGRCEPDVRAFLDADSDAARLRAAGRLDVEDRLLDDAPSGIVAESCARGVPVLGPDRGWIATVLGSTGCGVGARVDDVDDVVSAITRLIANHERYVVAARRAAAGLGADDFVAVLLGNQE
jgi:glycosyltransferase involved in cell wall biosynthesis